MSRIFNSPGGRIVCLLFTACIAAFILTGRLETSLFIQPGMVDSGEKLLQPELSDGLSAWYMPLACVASALIENHAAPGRKAFFIKAILCLCVLLVFSLGCLLHSPACGFVSSVLFVLLYRPLDCVDLEQLMYSGSLLLVGNFLAASFRSGTLKNLLIGLAIGISLFVKGILVLFPLVISAYSAASSARNRQSRLLFGDAAGRFLKDFFKSLALIMLVPAIAVLLWGCSHYASGRRFVFLEEGRRAHSNIISGAMGLVCTMEGDAYSLAGISRDDNVMLWAAGEIARHPLRYLIAGFRRLWFLISMHPILVLAGMLGLWRLRKNNGCILAGLLAGYFLLIHCLMAVEHRYMMPFWFLLCPLAAASIDCVCSPSLVKQVPREAGPLSFILHSLRGVGWGMTILWLCFIPVFAVFLYTGYLVLAYPPASRSSGSYLNAVARNPANSWTWNKLGHHYMGKGDVDKAVDAFEKSYRLNPLAQSDYILALFVKGDYENVEVNGIAFEDFLSPNTGSGHHNLLVNALVKLERGRYKDAVEALNRAKDIYCCFRNVPTTPYERRLLKQLRDNCRSRERDIVNEVLLKVPPERRLKLAKKLPRISVDNTWLLKKTAEELLEKREGGRMRKKAAKPPETGETGKSGVQPARSAESSMSKARLEAVQLTDMGVKKALAGLNIEAAGDFKKAINADPHYLQAYLSLGAVYISRNETEKAVILYKRALETNRDKKNSPLYKLLKKDLKDLSSSAKTGQSQ